MTYFRGVAAGGDEIEILQTHLMSAVPHSEKRLKIFIKSSSAEEVKGAWETVFGLLREGSWTS
jgi:hypothetical protein